MAKPMQSVSVRVRDTMFSYLVSGEGAPIVVFHGNPGTKQDMKPLCESLVKRNFRAVALDRAGHGNSEDFPPEDGDNLWIDAEVYADLIKKVCGGKVFLVGYSLGAHIALKIAAKFPEQVAGIVMVGPFVIPKDPNEAVSKLPEMSAGYFLGTILGFLVPLFASGKIKKHLADELLPAQISESVLEDKVKRFAAFDKIVATLADKNLMLKSRADLEKVWNKISCPILAVCGSQDQICDQAKQWEVIAKALPATEKAMIEDGGHGLPMTHTEKVADLIEGFCRKHDTRG